MSDENNPLDNVYRRGLDTFKELEDDDDNYWFKSFHTRPEKQFSYSDKRIFLGYYQRNNVPFYMDTAEAFRALWLGMTRCLHPDTLVETRDGVVRIDDVEDGTEVHVKNEFFTHGEPLYEPATRLEDRDGVEFWRLSFYNYANEETEVVCSEDHEFFTYDEDGYLKGVLAQDLEEGDVMAGANEWVFEGRERAGVGRACDLYVPGAGNFHLGNGLLTHNSGKSWMLRAFADRAHEAGFGVVYLSDVKDEAKSSREPLQKQFHELLHPHEKPKAKPVITLRPTFFYGHDHGKLSKDNHWYSVHPLDMEESDFRTLVGASQMTDNQQRMLGELWGLVQAEYENRRDEFSIDALLDLVDELEMGDANQHGYLKDKLRPLRDSGFYMPEHSKNIVEYVRKGFIPSINMEGFDNLARGSSFNYPVVFMSIVYRQLVNARIRAHNDPHFDFPKLLVLIDEMTRFVPANRENSFKTQLLESIDLHTRYFVAIGMATQQLQKVPDAIISQCKHIFLPHNADVSDIASVLKRFGMAKIQAANNMAAKLKRQMPKYGWLYFCKDKTRPELLSPMSAPLSAHMQTSS